LAALPGVAAVEEDQPIQLANTQSAVTWGLDRVDQRHLPLSSTYSYTADGSGVTAYVIDTGIEFAHSDFGGRAVSGYDSIDGGSADDCNGHGTHVSGTIGGSAYGMAKGVRLVAVRVLDCAGAGTIAGVIAGIDWVTYNHNGPSVANMSLGGGFNQPVNDAVTKSIAHGVTYAIAAGNSNANACSFSPASTPGAITVAATTLSGGTDVRAGFSNYGSCVDVFDPGVNITSAWIGSTTAINTISGTSMASPHVAGLAALYLQSNPYATPALVNDVVKSTAVAGIVSDPAGSPNLFARKWNGILAATGSSSYQPDGSYWYQGTSGYIQGWLAGTGGTDPDLYLLRWNGSAWVYVASSTSFTPNERIVYLGTAGYYRFQVYAYSGAGSYDLWANHPA
jgi:subtilisin family serine protease